MDIKVQKARPADADELTEIAHASKRYWPYEETFLRAWENELKISPEFIAHHRVHCAVAGDRILGFYALSGGGPDWELEHLWVRPECIGKGVGSALFQHAVETVRAGGREMQIFPSS